ncbi:insulin-like growth factor-binding protein 7 [Glandiceps talaboti]
MKVVLFVLFVLLLASPIAQSTTKDCKRCNQDACPEVVDCQAGVVKDFCDCCDVCARTEGEECGGENLELGRCVDGLVCSDEGQCECEQPEHVCGSDNEDYTSVCALNSASQKLVESGGKGLEVAYKGYCKRAPQVSILHREKTKDVGSEMYFHCAGSGVPTPKVRWYYDGEELPGDYNVNIQARSVPGKHEMESWASIYGVKPSNAGEYECRMINSEGEARETASLIVNLNLTKKTEL